MLHTDAMVAPPSSPSSPSASTHHDPLHTKLDLALRTADFWRRATGIYAAYKGKQVQDAALRVAGWSEDRLKDELWEPHHAWAGKQMYDLAVSARGFYLKVRGKGWWRVEVCFGTSVCANGWAIHTQGSCPRAAAAASARGGGGRCVKEAAAVVF